MQLQQAIVYRQGSKRTCVCLVGAQRCLLQAADKLGKLPVTMRKPLNSASRVRLHEGHVLKLLVEAQPQ